MTAKATKYGRLTETGRRIGRRVECVCKCGQRKWMRQDHLRAGFIRSCGCLRRETARAQKLTHGATSTAEYRSWCAMKQRCENSSNADYALYGGRGIRVAPEWRDDFVVFLAHVGPRPKGTSLDRIDNERGYEPGNVRWATASEQSSNRRHIVRLTVRGTTGSLSQLARAFGVSYGKVWQRINRDGWSVERALLAP